MKFQSALLFITFTIGFVSLSFAQNDKLVGDTNGDNILDSKDIETIVSHILDITHLIGQAFELADTNEDGNIDISDLSFLISKINNSTEPDNPVLPDTPEEPDQPNPPVEPSETHSYIDLGITDSNGQPILWAKHNIGATKPCEYGSLYAWGETSVKTSYTVQTYRWFANQDECKYDTTDGLLFLEREDDVATSEWGNNWRMPSSEEMTLLKTKCQSTWIEPGNDLYEGIPGIEIVGPNGNSIFLPAAGMNNQNGLTNKGVWCAYWTNERKNNSYEDGLMYVYSQKNNVVAVTFGKRFQGLSVRPVYIGTRPNIEPDQPDMPDQPSNPDTPDTPEEPDQPDTPDQPSNPDTPDTPEEPDQPDTPDQPSNPDTPDTPEEPGQPDTPDQPSNPDTPDTPEEPGQPDTPDQPSNPDTPDTPEEPDQTDTPDQPSNPDTPDTPEEPDQPDTPDQPSNPDTPDTPEEPDQPDTPDQPSNPDTPDTPEEPEKPIHEYVDLGFVNSEGHPVLWATCNVGATEPYEKGDLYAWGETFVSAAFNWNSYTWGTQNKLIKYNAADNITTLLSEDDIAATWGEGWHTPTTEEIDLLKSNKCSYKWYTKGNTPYHGEAGVEITGPNGNTIFLPAAGYADGSTTAKEVGNYSIYWSSDRSKTTPYQAYIFAYSATSGLRPTEFANRYQGRSIRPVKVDTSITITPQEPEDPEQPDTPEEPEQPTSPTHEYVDLGLVNTEGHPVLWATCNVGASKPYEKGDLLAWGETTVNTAYTWNSYAWGTQNSISKYNTVDKQITLKAADDAAAAWGDDWHTPNTEELNLLKSATCKYKWFSAGNTPYHGEAGVEITGPNGNTIFLPAAGYADGSTTAKEVGKYCIYWSSDRSKTTPYQAYLFAYSATGGLRPTEYANRYQGRSVRPVKVDTSITITPDKPEPDKPDNPIVPEEPKPQTPSGSYLLENNAIYRFIRDFQYNPSDYSYSNVTQYVDTSFADGNRHKEWPAGITLGQKTYYNLIPGKTYTLDSIDSKGIAHTVTIKTSGQVRTIKTDGLDNIRDLGGWSTSDGKHVKYGMMFRGTELNTYQTIEHLDKVCSRHTMTASDIATLHDFLGIRAELDFRITTTEIAPANRGKSSLGSDVHYCYNPINYQKGKYNTDVSKKSFASALRFVITQLQDNHPVYFHCVWGSDRTGIFSSLVLGLLGVEQGNIDKEHELSTFCNHLRFRCRDENGETRYYVEYLIKDVKSFSGSSLQEKFKNWWISAGLTEEEINKFRSMMLE